MGQKTPAEGTILIIGGSGHYGTYIVNRLLRNNRKVRVLSRNGHKTRNIFESQVDVQEGDIEHITDYEALLHDVTGIIISLSAFNSRDIKNMIATEKDSVIRLLQNAYAKNIQRIVYISIWNVPEEVPQHPSAESAYVKASIEGYLHRSSFDWTILRSPASMATYFSMISNNKMIIPGTKKTPIPSIAPWDVAEITTQTVLRDDLAKKTFYLSGPEALSFDEAARRISVSNNQSLKTIHIPLSLIKPAYFISLLFTSLKPSYLYLSKILKNADVSANFPSSIQKEVDQAFYQLQTTFQYSPSSFDSFIAQYITD